MLKRGTHGLLLSCKGGVTARRKQADVCLSAPHPARRDHARHRSRGAHTATRRSRLCAVLGWFREGKCPCNPLQNRRQPSQGHGGLLSHPCPHTAEGTSCVREGRLGSHLHGHRLTHLGKGGSPGGSPRGTLHSRQQLRRSDAGP